MAIDDLEKDAGSDKQYLSGTEVSERKSHGAKYDGQIDEGIAANEDLHRGLKARQISMIALGGAIGTGLVIGSGSGLAKGGPVGLFLAYVIMGYACLGVMLSLGEMATYLPHKKGFSGYATRFVDPAMGFATGWNYLMKYLVVTPNNIVAATLVVTFWTNAVPVAAWLVIFIVGIILVNLLGIRLFGEIEFWMSFLKVVTLTGLIILGLVIDLGGAPNGDRIGFRYWRDQPFNHYIFDNDTGVFLGVWSCMGEFYFLRYFSRFFLQAARSCTDTSTLVGVTFGEAKNPRKTIPSTIRRTFFRLLVFYVGSIFIVGLIVRADDPDLAAANKQSTSAAASPFVLAIQRAEIKALPDILNACILCFVLSAANSDLYIGTRTLYGLAASGQAPRIFMRTNRFGTPYFCTAFCSAICCIAFLAVSSGSKKVFGYFVSLVTIFGALTWMSILWSHIRFMGALKAQGISRNDLPWKAPGQPYIAYSALAITMVVTFFKGFDAFTPRFNHETFITHYLGIPIYAVLYFGFKFYKKTKVIPLAEVDLLTGRKEYDDDAAQWEEKEAMEKRSIWKKIWDGA
ncbi:hypothetical protein JCM6882_007723 [Rhodosporidiobolus microsporus]